MPNSTTLANSAPVTTVGSAAARGTDVRAGSRATLICDLAGLVDRSDPTEVIPQLRAANGGHLRGDTTPDVPPLEVLDRAMAGFTAGSLGEGEYVRHVGAGLGWTGDDIHLVGLLSTLFGTVNVGVMEVLVDLRDQGWFLIGLDHSTHIRRGAYAEQLGIFDHVLPIPGGGAAHSPLSTSTGPIPAPRMRLDLTGTDPRFFARLRRLAPSGQGALMLTTTRPALASAARNQGFAAHIFAGAADLQARCSA